MTHNEERAEGGCLNAVPGPDDVVVFPPMPDGYYWAKYNHEHADGRWLIAQVYDSGNGQRELSRKVALTGVDLAFDLSSFTFGPRIEEPKE